MPVTGGIGARVGRRLSGALARKPAPIISRLDVRQDGATLLVDVVHHADLRPRAVWLTWSETDNWTLLTTLDPAAPSNHLRLDLEPLVHSAALGADGGTARLYLELEPPDETTPEPYRRALGRAARTTVGTLEPVRFGERTLTPYLSRGGVVSVAVQRELRPFGQVFVRTLRGRDATLRMTGRINTRHTVITGAQLQLKARTSGRRITRPLLLTPDPERGAARFGQHWYRFSFEMDWDVLWEDGVEATNDIFDAWALLQVEGREDVHQVRIGRTRFVVRQLSRPTWARHGDTAAAIMPYYTFKAKKTSFQIDVFDADTMDYLRKQVRNRRINRLRHRGKPIWLVGEQPYKAQDTGLAMFRHLRENHPEIDTFYVMDKASPEYASVEPLGNVVQHRSQEHVRLSLLADRVIGSHHPDFLYPLRTTQYRRAVRATRVFLQHGVIAMKWMVPNYGKGQGSFDTDLFIVSSEREKRYIVSDFGWDPEQVAVTGLTRFDSLFAGDVETRRQILIMPTWRAWLLDSDTYLESEYHQRWSSLLHSPRFRQLLDTYDVEAIFCLHPNMQTFSHLYADAPVRVINQGEVDVQYLLKQSAVLITDFSSVAFDFAFLDKPVIFYQYDRRRTLGLTGAHIDLDVELPGTIVLNEGPLLDALEQICRAGFAMQPGMRERADAFIDHRDRNSSERVFEAVQAAKRRPLTVKALLARPAPTLAFRVWRRSRWYFPTMRLMFRILRRLPADENTVVFEAGLGRQYADSPRYLYEELVRRGSTARKVWAYSGKIHTTDDNTTVVDRLSPSYFWHLGRARYWVNSQNFPYYLRRRPDGVFVQTWHGTPLKRMLKDVEEVHGRDEGYIDRMTQAAAQWSLLVSPSPYASAAISGAYGYGGTALEVGYPRNDLLTGPDRDRIAALVRSRLGLRSGTRVILYAPTFRDDQGRGRGRFGFRLPFDVARMSERLGPDTVLLLRMHVVVSQDLRIPPEYAERVIDVSSYPEIQELYLASDAVVTDYSSVFFDYALLRRPIVFYAYDLDDYRDRLRGFYLDFLHDLPGPIVTTEDELLDTLDDLDGVKAAYGAKYDEFLARFAPNDDGHATERVVDTVFGAIAGRRPAADPAPQEISPTGPAAVGAPSAGVTP